MCRPDKDPVAEVCETYIAQSPVQGLVLVVLYVRSQANQCESVAGYEVNEVDVGYSTIKPKGVIA